MYPKRSIVDLILFRVFINELFRFIKEANLANFAYDSFIYALCKDIDRLIKSLEKESEVSIKRFEEINMVVNSENSK